MDSSQVATRLTHERDSECVSDPVVLSMGHGSLGQQHVWPHVSEAQHRSRLVPCSSRPAPLIVRHVFAPCFAPRPLESLGGLRRDLHQSANIVRLGGLRGRDFLVLFAEGLRDTSVQSLEAASPTRSTCLALS